MIHCLMFIFGACFGSFLCCQARRLHLKETGKPKLGARSVCPQCLHQLAWYENIPLISWLIQKGKCRNCHAKIGIAEILSEFTAGLAFVFISVAFVQASIGIQLTPFGLFPVDAGPTIFGAGSVFNYLIFALTILLTLALIFLSIYDGLYGKLPTFALIISALITAAIVVLRLVTVNFATQDILDTILAIAVLGGIYLSLYLISKGKWVGDGDWLLGSVIAAALGTPWLALIVLFLSNFAACLVSLPVIKKNKNHKIYFGPFLVFAYVVTLLLSCMGIMNYLVSL